MTAAPSTAPSVASTIACSELILGGQKSGKSRRSELQMAVDGINFKKNRPLAPVNIEQIAFLLIASYRGADPVARVGNEIGLALILKGAT